jgi:hypothetical protein
VKISQKDFQRSSGRENDGFPADSGHGLGRTVNFRRPIENIALRIAGGSDYCADLPLGTVVEFRIDPKILGCSTK